MKLADLILRHLVLLLLQSRLKYPLYLLWLTMLVMFAQALKAEGYVGAVFTQFSDVEAELNGFFSYDRKVVKVDLQALAKMHGDLIVQ